MKYDKLKKLIAEFPDFPKTGVSFKDISSLLNNPEHFKLAVDEMCKAVEGLDFNKILAIESRGFIFGSAIAYKMKKSLIMCRKPGKLPGELIAQKYQSEYTSSELTIQSGKLEAQDKVLIIDDVLATGYTVQASYDLVKPFAFVAGCLFLIELDYLKGRKKLLENTQLSNDAIISLIHYGQ
jgi:adenine phosphoribosyltransferase